MTDQVHWSRAALSAPSQAHQTRVLSQVLLAISILSILGPLWIILSFCLFKQVRTFRHQLILGLAVSDCLMAVNFLSSCAMNLSGNLLSYPAQKTFCTINGFMAQTFVIQTDYWVLAIAVCTFLILAEYKHASMWIQNHRIVLWGLPWGFSILWAGIGLARLGYGNIGAWCWFTSDRVRLLVNFVPRWLIILILIILYARLYHIIHKVHARSVHTATATNTALSTLDPNPFPMPQGSRMPRPSIARGLSTRSKVNETESSTLSSRIGNATRRLRGPKLKKMAYQMMSYPLVYTLIWTIPTAIRVYQATSGRAAPFPIATVDKACIVVQGFADAVIYGVNESSLSVWRERFSRGPPTEPAPAVAAEAGAGVASYGRGNAAVGLSTLSTIESES